MNLFADKNTDLPKILGWRIPSSWFQSLNPAFIILFAPSSPPPGAPGSARTGSPRPP
jgi:dipeptide/tripeptide permease